MSYINFFSENTDYGSSRTRSFSEIFPSYTVFEDTWRSTTFSAQAVALIGTRGETNITSLSLIYELLLARYANSTIASSDEGRFMLQCMSTIFQHGPTFLKRLDIQHMLHEMDLKSEDFLVGSTQIFNTSFNPSQSPTSQTLTELDTINQQNVTKQKRDKFKALAILDELLRSDITEDFVSKFKYLFRVVVTPQRPLFYTTETEDQND